MRLKIFFDTISFDIRKNIHKIQAYRLDVVFFTLIER